MAIEILKRLTWSFLVDAKQLFELFVYWRFLCNTLLSSTTALWLWVHIVVPSPGAYALTWDFHLVKINWVPVERRVELCTCTAVFKYWKRITPSFLNDKFMPSLNNYNTRSQMVLDIPLCRTNKGLKSISFLGPKVWTKLSSNIKATATVASFTIFFALKR